MADRFEKAMVAAKEWPLSDSARTLLQDLFIVAESMKDKAAPADTRDLFERTFALCDRQKWRHKDGSYMHKDIQAKWEGWQKALETVPSEAGGRDAG